MDNPNETTAHQKEESNPEDVRARVKNLVEKTAALNESIDHVRKNLKEAATESRSSE
jgi:ppGpp synthetase/RelA/SpoT-type nucleotidyltranferase